MLNDLTRGKNIRSFSVSPENLTGEKSGGARASVGTASEAARELGKGWKVNPYVWVKSGEKLVLADICGQGAIKHIWLTDSADAGRLLILRIYFDGQFRRTNPLPYMQPYTILDDIKGNGKYVGTYMYWGVKSNKWWGEGEIKFYIDGDTEYPSICGTGTEDYFCGAYNFDVDGKYVEYTTPYSGMYKLGETDKLYRVQPYFNMYRWHIVDPIYFKKDLKVTIQALGWRSEGRYCPLQDDISSVAYWYSDTLDDVYPKFPDANQLEIIID